MTRSENPSSIRDDGAVSVAILDVDGTLMDTNYHHALAWYRAFRQVGVRAPIWRIHRHIGMGGDQLIKAVAGEDVEREHGERLRSAWDVLYTASMGETIPFAGARELMLDLKARGHAVVLASSAKEHQLEFYLDALGARDVADFWTSDADVEATKPEPDLVAAAMQRSGAARGVMVGDSVWDCEAAGRLGLETVALLSGGFSEAELGAAGAVRVFASIEDLRSELDRSPLARPSLAPR